MRGSRAKKLHKLALANPARHAAAFVNFGGGKSTFVQGGVRRAYLKLKREWNKS